MHGDGLQAILSSDGRKTVRYRTVRYRVSFVGRSKNRRYRRGFCRDGAGPLKKVITPPLNESRVLFASARDSVRPTPP